MLRVAPSLVVTLMAHSGPAETDSTELSAHASGEEHSESSAHSRSKSRDDGVLVLCRLRSSCGAIAQRAERCVAPAAGANARAALIGVRGWNRFVRARGTTSANMCRREGSPAAEGRGGANRICDAHAAAVSTVSTRHACAPALRATQHNTTIDWERNALQRDGGQQAQREA